LYDLQVKRDNRKDNHWELAIPKAETWKNTPMETALEKMQKPVSITHQVVTT
jgi:hypothetical protein